MGIIITGIIVAVVIAFGAGVVLNSSQKTVYQSQPMPTVRVGDPGTNLVGPDWSGLNDADKSRRQEAHGGGRQQ